MTPLDQKTQNDVTQVIEYLLGSVDGKVLGFLTPCKFTHRKRVDEEPWHEWEETTYPVSIQIKSVGCSLAISSLYIDSIEDAVWRACHDLIYAKGISDKDKQEILIELSSREFLAFRKGKNNL